MGLFKLADLVIDRGAPEPIFKRAHAKGVQRKSVFELAPDQMRHLVSSTGKSPSLLNKAAYSILYGVLGNLVIFLFLTTFLRLHEIARFIPWIIAFNAISTGYSLLEKTRDRLRHKQKSAIGAGILNVLISYLVLNFIYVYFVGEFIFGGSDLAHFLVIGVICSELGALLAIKYFKL